MIEPGCAPIFGISTSATNVLGAILWYPSFPAAFTAFAICWILIQILLHWAPRFGLVDHPDERRVHVHVTPKGGGLAIFLALLVSLSVIPGLGDFDQRSLTIIAGGAVIMVLGLLDDLYSLSWKIRLLVQSVTVLAVFGWPMQTGWLYPLVAFIWVVGLINAFNMLDNMDALSAGVAWIVCFLLIAVHFLIGGGCPVGEDPLRTPPQLVIYFALLGALTAFMSFNRSPARIFMGDAGSTFLGFILGMTSLNEQILTPKLLETWPVPLCLFAVPWYDLTTVVLLRLRQGRSPFHADKQHLSHRLVERGLTKVQAVRVIHLLALASGLAGLALLQSKEDTAILIVAQVLCWWLAIACIEYFSRKVEKKSEKDEETKSQN